MSSTQIEAVSQLYRHWVANFNLSLEDRRDLIEGWAVLASEPQAVDYLEREAGGIPAMWAIPSQSAEDRVILGLHGGGFVAGSMFTHRKLFGHLAKAIGARALILNYRLSPESTHPGPVNDVVAAYAWLLAQGIKPEHVVFTGDSAGGGLSVTSQVLARQRRLPVPAGALLLSPWVDMEVTGQSWESNGANDELFVNREMVRGLARAFLGAEGDPRDPLANPLYANLSGLAPTYIQVGGDEVLLDDSRRLAVRLRNAGVDVKMDVFPEQQHTFQMAAGRAPEADAAIQKLVEWARPRLGLEDAAPLRVANG
jgi:acetyl esterase/lipase